MLLLSHQFYAAQEHYRDLQREAARERMLTAHQGRRQKRKRPSFWSKLGRSFSQQFLSPQEA